MSRTQPPTLATTSAPPSTEVHPQRDGWTGAQRLAILTEYDSYPKGDPRRGELLRRHGLYTAHLSKWRAQRKRGTLARLEPRPVGRPAQPRDPQQDEIARLQREIARLQTALDKAQLVIDIQKKLQCCLGCPSRPHRPTGCDAFRGAGIGQYCRHYGCLHSVGRTTK